MDADVKDVDPLYDFGGFFEFVGRAKEDEQQQLVQLGCKIAETSVLAGAWKAPLGPKEAYPGTAGWPVGGTGQCSEADTTFHLEIAFWRAKKRLPPCLYANNFKTGDC